MFILVTRRLHYVQRDFMMQTLLFFLFTGIAGLIFCKVERTTYVDGIYYIVVTTLTIGFGDITPQTAIMKVLTFPFTVIGIGLLALIVTSIVHLLADRARRRKAELKKRLKKKVSEKKRIHAGYGSKLRLWSARPPSGDGPRLKRSLTLQEELIKLHEDDWKRQRRANLKSMVTGFTVFLIFWFIGALIFYFVEVRIHLLKMLTIAMGIRKFSLLLLHARLYQIELIIDSF
jgi:potassium channel subfamily K, other eukaryote